MAALLQLIPLLISLFGSDFSKVIPLITKIVAAAKAKDYTTVMTLLGELLALLVKTKPAPIPGPVVGATAEGNVVSAAVAAGADQAEVEALVAAVQ